MNEVADDADRAIRFDRQPSIGRAFEAWGKHLFGNNIRVEGDDSRLPECSDNVAL